MSEMLPLFPLGALLYPGLYPGMLLPLHIFEERYRQLVRDLLDGSEPRRFGVTAIREGREAGVDSVRSLYGIGCTATGGQGGSRGITGRGRPWLNRKPRQPTSRSAPPRSRPTSARPTGRRSSAGC